MKVDEEIYNTIKYYATEEPMLGLNLEPSRERAIEAIKAYRRQKEYVTEFLERRKKYEDFLKELEPIEPQTTNQENTNPSS